MEGLDKLTSPHLEILGLHINLNQGISNQVPESTPVEVPVPPAIVPSVIDLGELQAPNFLKALRVEIFVCAPDLEKCALQQGWFSLDRAGELSGPTNHCTTKKWLKL